MGADEKLTLLTSDGDFIADVFESDLQRSHRHPHRVHWNGRAFDRGSTTEGDNRPLYFEVTPA